MLLSLMEMKLSFCELQYMNLYQSSSYSVFRTEVEMEAFIVDYSLQYSYILNFRIQLSLYFTLPHTIPFFEFFNLGESVTKVNRAA